MKKQRTHRAWLILAGCCALQAGTLGAVWNTTGVFTVPVCTELGFEIGEFSLFKTICGIASCAVLPFVGKILNRWNIRVTLSAAAIVYSGAVMLMSRCGELWQWYVMGAIMGLASALLTMLPAGLILANWFAKRTGFAISVSSCCAGLAGMIMMMVLDAVIQSSGWRTAFVLNGAVCLALTLPFTLFVLRYRPSDAGLKPYGYEEGEDGKEKTSFEPASVPKRLYILVGLIQIAFYCSAAMQSFLTPFGISVGLAASVAAALASCGLVGNTLGKLALGTINDVAGAKKAGLTATATTLIGALTLLCLRGPLLFAGAFAFGVSMPATSVVTPLIIKELFGQKRYSDVYPFMTMLGIFVSSCILTVYGYAYDFTGSYIIDFAFCAALLAAAYALICIAFLPKVRGTKDAVSGTRLI